MIDDASSDINSNHLKLSQKFCNILVIWGLIWCLWMLLSMSWRWQTTLYCEILSLLDTLQVLLTRLTSMAWSMTLKSTVLGLPELPDHLGSCNLSKICWAIWLPYCTVTFLTTNIFGCFCSIMAQFELVKQKFSNWTPLHIHLCGFQITH